MATIDMDRLTAETRSRIAMIQAKAAFQNGETLRLSDVLLGLIELGSVRATELMDEAKHR
jgi:hypothetical protein